MILSVVLALSACSTPNEAPKPAAPPVVVPPAAAPAAPVDAHAGHHEGEEAHEAAEEAEGGAATVAPDSYAGIIAEMRTRQATIAALITAGKYKDVHPEAKVLMDLAVAAPAKADAAGKATVALKALDLKEKADELHDKADSGDAAGAKAAFDAVVADIDALAAASK